MITDIEILDILTGTDSSNYLKHYGMPRRSGRYPYGSGDNPYQHTGDMLSRVEALKEKGWTETPENIKKEFNLSTTQYRSMISIAKNERKVYKMNRAYALSKDGLGPTEIGKVMGEAEGTIRGWLKNDPSKFKVNPTRKLANDIKAVVDQKKMLDIGRGIELELGVSKEQLRNAYSLLEQEGYHIYKGGIPQVTNKGQQTNQIVLAAPGVEHKEIYNYDKIGTLNDYKMNERGDKLVDKIVSPKSISSDRLMVVYGNEGGTAKDGVVEIRRGCKDLSLTNFDISGNPDGVNNYQQVRILIDDKKYIKGMAVYADDLPPGIDMRFNTNKSLGEKYKTKLDVLKDIKSDPENPFGSLIKKQNYYFDENGERKLGGINVRSSEGDWTEWKDTLPSQFLAKQPMSMINKQLKISKDDKLAEFKELKELTNPTVKKKLLEDFAESCDANAVDLKAASLPGQKYHVILPVNSMKDTEIYAPQYENGTQLALVRYPHGGLFEIPILTVNNRRTEGKNMIGTNSIDAVGINSKVAERLSGADFDGDTVMCIPTNNGFTNVKNKNPLEGLKGFDSKMYQYHTKTKEIVDGKEVVRLFDEDGREFKKMRNTQTEMGIISNLITDMTIRGAKDSELARAVRHSMVVIDAEKHELDYKKSYIDNGIQELQKRYQFHIDKDGTVHERGASTVISSAKGEATVVRRQGNPKVNIKGTPDYDPTRPEGSLIFKEADDATYTVTNKKGEVITKKRTQASTKMAEVDDAFDLVSDKENKKERAYAEYANFMKDLARQARIEIYNTPNLVYDKNASKEYAEEVKSLNDKLRIAKLNMPKERQAQRMANAEVKAIKDASSEPIKTADEKKLGQKALTKFRTMYGAHRQNIVITDREWTAIQKGAISDSKLRDILNNADKDVLREKATPRNNGNSISPSKESRIKSLLASGYTLSEIARKVGVSASTVEKYSK